MRPESNPVKCQWTAEQLNDRTVSFIPTRNGMGVRATGQLLAVEVPGGLYIQISVKKAASQPLLYWLSQAEADRLQKSDTPSQADFVLA